jgi:hypothetical protein
MLEEIINYVLSLQQQVQVSGVSITPAGRILSYDAASP